MATLKELRIQGVRNIASLEIASLQSVNVFYGPNGSGKTSILEAIHILGMARSFRGHAIRSVIAHGRDDCVVSGTTVMAPNRGAVRLGVQRKKGEDARIRISGRPVRSVATLVSQFPLQVINADSFQLLTGPPAARRRYLDWGVFHVEQGFYPQWQRFQRCIKQRNSLLRRGNISQRELSVWTRDLAASGEAVTQYRRRYFERLLPRFADAMARLAPSLKGIALGFRQGWDKSLGYQEALTGSLESDLAQGYTQTGPQRADIRVTVAGHGAGETLSRGQQKLVVCALKLAQGQLLSEEQAVSCTYLLDDLPSELDEVHSRAVCGVLAAMDSQVFITCVTPAEISAVWPESSPLAMFHVEHGAVKPA